MTTKYVTEGDRIHKEKTVLNRYVVDYEKDSEEWYNYVQTLLFEEVKQLLSENASIEL